MIALAYLLAAIVAGSLAAFALPAGLRFEERVAIGASAGLGIVTVWTGLLAALFGLSRLTIGVAALTAAAAAAWLASRSSARGRLAADWAELRARARGLPFLATAVTFAAFSAVLAVIFIRIVAIEGATMTGTLNSAGDWRFHLAQASSMSYAGNFPPDVPTMAGEPLTYHFGTNLLAAALVEGGMLLVPAMKLTAVLLACCGVALLMTFARQLAGWRAALLTPALFYLGGGLGFVNFFSDLADADSAGHLLRHAPRGYTSNYKWASGGPADPITDPGPVTNLEWLNPTYAYLVPQRATLFGLALVLGSLTLLLRGLLDGDRRWLLAAGATAGTLPLIHAHGALVVALAVPVAMLVAWWAAREREPLTGLLRRVAWFALPALVVSLPALAWVASGDSTTDEMRIHLGWMADGDFVPWFWLKNAGAIILLAAAGLWLYRRRTVTLALGVAACAVFLAANLFAVQPYEWDNTKLLVYGYAVAAALAAGALVALARRRVAGLAVAAILLVSMTLAGALDAATTLLPAHRLTVFDRGTLNAAEYIRHNSKPASVFLTPERGHMALSSIGGRALVLGNPDVLDLIGIDTARRRAAVAAMYRGRPDAPALLRRYGVDYVAFRSRSDHRGYTPNEAWYRSRFARWGPPGTVRFYDVRTPRASR